jgi:hypothetical protein
LPHRLAKLCSQAPEAECAAFSWMQYGREKQAFNSETPTSIVL